MSSPALTLLPIDAEMLPLLDSGDGAAFEARHGFAVPDGAAELLRQVVAMTLELYCREPRAPEWGGFLVGDDGAGAVVAMCGYKTAPTAEGEIEIAYGTVPAFEGQGYATAVAGELTRRALASPAVHRVIAHTLAEPNASGRVLTKNGFRRAGETVDPEDGPVWRWERDRT